MDTCNATHDVDGHLAPADGACDWLSKACAVWKTEDGGMMAVIFWNDGRFSIEGEAATPDDLGITFCPGCGRRLNFVYG